MVILTVWGLNLHIWLVFSNLQLWATQGMPGWDLKWRFGRHNSPLSCPGQLVVILGRPVWAPTGSQNLSRGEKLTSKTSSEKKRGQKSRGLGQANFWWQSVQRVNSGVAASFGKLPGQSQLCEWWCSGCQEALVCQTLVFVEVYSCLFLLVMACWQNKYQEIETSRLMWQTTCCRNKNDGRIKDTWCLLRR